MVALKTERRVYIWKMLPEVLPRDASVDTSFEQVFEILKSEFEAGRAFAFLGSDGKFIDDDDDQDVKNCIFIADIDESSHADIITVLLNRGDPDVAHPSFLNPIAKTVTPVQPDADQVQGWSAHLVIQRGADSNGRHRACFERMTGVSSTLVQRFFDKILDTVTKDNPDFLYEKPVKRNKKTVIEDRPYKVRLNTNKVPSESLKNDLDKGVLSNVTLIKVNPSYDGPGNPHVAASVRERLTISARSVEKNEAEQFISDVMSWGRNKEYDEIQVRVDGLPGNTSSSPRFDLEIADALDTLYARSIRITGFGELLETCYSNINSEIDTQMRGVLSDPDHW